eukprot:1685228-Rhodomonas_salina.1
MFPRSFFANLLRSSLLSSTALCMVSPKCSKTRLVLPGLLSVGSVLRAFALVFPRAPASCNQQLPFAMSANLIREQKPCPNPRSWFLE